MKHSIEILIGPDGTLTIDAVGFKGADCDHATKFLERALGVTAEKRRKSEYHQATRHLPQQRLGT